jgi:PPOX class probable F420-dependent enzyme
LDDLDCTEMAIRARLVAEQTLSAVIFPLRESHVAGWVHAACRRTEGDTVENFEHLRRTRTVLLTTRRRDGRTVDTPVSMAIDEAGRGYFRTWTTSGKAKRLANFPGVRVAPSSPNGHPGGSDQPGLVSRLTGADEALAGALLADRFPTVHGKIVPRLYRLRGRTPAFYRVIPAEEPTPWTGPA